MKPLKVQYFQGFSLCLWGFCLYEELYNKGIELVFLKEPHINDRDKC